MSLLLSATYGVAGVLAAVTAHQWSQVPDGNTVVMTQLDNGRVERALQLLAAVSVSPYSVSDKLTKLTFNCHLK